MRFLSRTLPLTTALIIAGCLSIIGCSKGQVKPTEAEQQVQRIDAFLTNLEEVYAKGDLPALESQFSAEYRNQFPEVFQAVRTVHEKMSSIRMDLTVDVIHIEGQSIKVLLHWEVNAKTDETASQFRGNTTLKLIDQEFLQIVDLQGDNPFLFPDRVQIGG